MTTSFAQADDAALEVYFRVYDGGAPHPIALNIAVSVWFCRCPQVDGRQARMRVSRLLDARALRCAA